MLQHSICLKKNHYLDMALKCLGWYVKNDNIDIGGCSTHPHNYLLQLLSETGIIGCLLNNLVLIMAGL